MKAAIPQERPHRKWAIAGMVLAILFSAFHALADGMPVYRVTPTATGGGDGQSWSSAMTIAEAVAAIAANPSTEQAILMKTGVYALSEGFVFKWAVTIRGGLAGTDDETLSAPDALSVLDGQDMVDIIVTFTEMKKTDVATFERVEFARAHRRAISRTWASNPGGVGKEADARYGDIHLLSCRFTGNGVNYDMGYSGDGGRAIYFRSYYMWSDAELVCSNCVFGGNVATTGWSGKAAVYLQSLKRAEFVDCSFVTNGLAWTRSIETSSGYAAGSACIYSDYTPTVLNRCKFIANRISSYGNATYPNAIVELVNSRMERTWSCAVSNCLFLCNESTMGASSTSPRCGALMINDSTKKATTEVVNCTFAYNICNSSEGPAGLNVVNGLVKVRNSIFYGNRLMPQDSPRGCDLRLCGNSAKVDLGYCLFTSFDKDNPAANANVFCNSGSTLDCSAGHILSGDPLFVTTDSDFAALISYPVFGSVTKLALTPDAETLAKILAFDLHVTSGTSPAVDAGDDSPYDREPSPNGERINIGIYGNTPEAHVTASAQPEIVNDEVLLSFPYGTSQAHYVFELGGAAGVSYSASAEVSWTTNDADWVVARTYESLGNGAKVDDDFKFAFLQGSLLRVRVTVSAYGAEERAATAATTVSNPYPIWCGKGGGAGVFHVRPGATGDGSGSDWFNAAVTLPMAKPAGVAEIWITTNVFRMGTRSVSYDGPLTIIGGFCGLECAAEERNAKAVTIFDAEDEEDYALNLTYTGSNRLERLVFKRAARRGLFTKINAPSHLDLVDCSFLANGLSRADNWLDNGGRALDLNGVDNTSDNTVTISNCCFGGNAIGIKNQTPGIGAVRLDRLRHVEIRDTLFVTNGVAWFCPLDAQNSSAGAGALHSTDTALSLVGCKFIGNRIPSGADNTNYRSSIIAINVWGSCGITNCLFMANESVCGDSGNVGSRTTGALCIMGDASLPADIVNCTFAYNLFNATHGAAGLTVLKGAVRVRNSIFFGNRILPSATAGCDLSLTGADCTLRADYTLFGSCDASNVWAAGGSRITYGEGIYEGDPRLVTRLAAFDELVVTTNAGLLATLAFMPDQDTLDKVLSLNAHLRGGNGYCDEVTGRHVSFGGKSSPAIDRGDPATDYSREPTPNGGRVNMGAYGNTPYATATRPSGMTIRIR